VLDNHHTRQHEHDDRRHAARPRAGRTAPALTQDVRHGLTANSVLICAYDHTPACRHQSGGDHPQEPEPERPASAGQHTTATPELYPQSALATAGKPVTISPPATRATLDTSGPTFAVFLLGVIIIVGGLIYFPMLILGPIGERLIG
jgi:hypothetical protein